MTKAKPSARKRRGWQRGLPVLTAQGVTLRGLRRSDAPSLLAHLSKPSVLRYIDPCPNSVEGFRRFIAWTHDRRTAGRHACFGIIPSGQTTPVGIVQVWPIASGFQIAEWGFALSDLHWGTGLFVSSAHLMFDFAFGTLATTRLEARAIVDNGRGNGVLRKLGASREGVLRGSSRDGEVLADHVMWSILSHEGTALRYGRRKAG